jgi:hypothetical protein
MIVQGSRTDLDPAHCGHDVPPNAHGFRVHHTKSNTPMPANQLTALYTEVLGPIQKTVIAEIREDIKSSRL